MPRQESSKTNSGDAGPGPAERVKDPGEANQRKQIDQINSARDDVRDVRNRVVESSVTGRLTPRVANTAYREVITSYALLLAPYLRGDKFGDSGLWEGGEESLAVVSIPAPNPDNVDAEIDSFSPGKYSLEINGVKDFITTPTPLSVTFEATTSHELRDQDTVTVPKTAEIDRQSLDGIVIALDEFRVDMGLGLKLPDVVEDRSNDPF